MTPRTPAVVVVDLAGGVLDPHTPVLRADDPMIARGDGVFETLLVRDGRACLLDAHLVRLAASAATIGLPSLDEAGWRAAVATALARWSGGEAVLRLLYGRGTGGSPTAMVTVSAVPQRVVAARRDGVSAVTLDRGSPGVGPAGPWSLAGVKSQSYAVFAAAQREAERLGASDVVLVGSDGYVLEGCERAAIRVTDLGVAQGLWLLSSVTLAARVHTLDGVALPHAPMAAEVAELVDLGVGEQA
ncbi:MAG: putative amino acid aminotransferase [Mycobacterium sp.]|nr:putative amino acid aminotransferase [Mycobacterium sp.]